MSDPRRGKIDVYILINSSHQILLVESIDRRLIISFRECPEYLMEGSKEEDRTNDRSEDGKRSLIY